MRLQNKIKSKFKPIMAMLLAFLTTFGAMPLNVLANETVYVPEQSIEAEPFYARIDGEDVLVPGDGIVSVQIEGFREPFEIEVPRYFYVSGEKIPSNDDTIESITPVVTSLSPLTADLHTNEEPLPILGLIVSFSGALPSGPVVSEIGQEFTHPAYVTMNGQIVSSRRYVVTINGVSYEAFCVNPNLPGPGSPGAVYELTGADGERFRTVLRYGWPINPALTNPALANDDRTWNVYMTRVAIAYLGNPSATWGRLVGGTRSAVDDRISGANGAAAKANSPAITVNNETNSERDGITQQSPSFVLGNSRRTNCHRNPFRFEWVQGTPAGTRLYVDGIFVAAAPSNPTGIFSYISGSGFTTISDFHFVMPAGSEGQTARVNLVGVNNQYSGRVFVMQNPNDVDAWQDLVFYIPEALASAAYTWDYEPYIPDRGSLRIIKRSGATNQGLAGAVFNITGPSGFNQTVTTPLSGEVVLTDLEPGVYTITEVMPPAGYRLSSPVTQTITVTAGGGTHNAVSDLISSMSVTSINGSAGWAASPTPMRSSAQTSSSIIANLTPGQVFIIIDEQGAWWEIQLEDETTGWIEHRAAFINAPDFIPTMRFNNTNARAAVFTSGGYNVPGVTGQVLYNHWADSRPNRNYDFIIPILYSTGQKLANAQAAAQASGHTIVLYDAYRPSSAQVQVHSAMQQLMNDNASVRNAINGYGGLTWFISSGISNHQRGAAVDVRLASASGVNHPMPTSIHDLHPNSALLSPPVAFAFWPTWANHANRTAPFTPGNAMFLPYAVRLQEIMAGAGFTSLASEWWHFDDRDGVAIANNAGINGNFNPQSPFVAVSGNGSNGDNPGNGNSISPNGSNIATVTFINQPTITNGNGGNGGDNGVTIQKICAVTRENIPGALMRLRGMSAFYVSTEDGQMIYINNTGINTSQVLTAGATTAMPGSVTSTVRDGVWILEGLPYGFFMVEEERAPEGFSLYPQHTAFGFWKLPPNVRIDSPDGDFYIIEKDPLDNHILITFENMPFSEIVIYKREVSNGIGNNQLLSGATFRIEGFYPGNPAIPIDRVATTGADGRVVFSDLPAGHFTITEIQPPTGYLLGENNVWTVNIGWGQTVAAGTANSHTFFNVPKSSLEILKVDGLSNEPLAGAIFELLDPTTGETWQATSGANGIAIFGKGSNGNFLYPGRTYIIREIVAPEGYVLMEGPREIVLSPGDENRVTWRNWQNPGLTIIKQCQDTGERLAGAEFTIQAQGSGRPLPTDFPLITNVNGEIHIPWTLFEGETERTFIVTEVVPPPGFHLANPNWQTVTMQAGHDHTVLFQNRRMPGLTIQKRDARTGEAIEDAEFTIYKITEPGRGYITGNPFRTGPDGRIVLHELHAGRYRIVETRPALNYWLDPMEQNRSWIVEIRPNEDYLLIVENTLLPSLVITKWNMVTMRPVPLTHFRVEFEVPNSPNVVEIGRFVTDQNGQIILPFVEPGWYRITEIFPAPGMALNLNNNYRQFLRPGDNSYALLQYFRNAGIHPPLQSNVVDLPPSNPQTPPPEPNPNPDLGNPQQVNSPEFPFTPEQWEAMNYSARQQFLRSQISVTDGAQWLAPGGSNIFNWPLNSIVIKKTCSVTGQLLPGATFNLIHTSAGVSGTLGTVIGTYTTGPSGIIVITGLVPGSYVVREERPPTNFTLSVNNTQTAFLAPDGHSVIELNFANDPYGSLLISKRCEVTHRPLQHAEFRVTRSDGSVVGTANGLFTTNAQGYVLIPNLPPDSYVVAETRAPDGFQIDRIPQTIWVGATGLTYQLHFTNIPYSTLIIRKLDSYNMTPLPGARFDVRHANGEWVGEFITDSNGLIEIQGLLGWFTVTETDPPPGFALDPNPTRTVHVGPRAPSVLTFLNPRLGSLTIEKTDQFGVPLAGAQFRVSHQNGQLVGYHTTGASGMINISNLPSGWFFVEETRAPQGFVISEAGRSVEVATNSAAHVTFVNLEVPSLSIVKIDNDGNPLPGARFRVSEIGGSFREYVTTGQGGLASMTLPVGTFEIVEVQAPAGFVITEPARTFVARAGEHRTETFVNHRIPSLVIEKVDIEGRPLQGAEFEIRRMDGGLVTRVTTNNGGIATVAQIDPGTYQVVESRAPQGFVPDSNAQVVTVTAGQTATLRFVNERIPSLTIEKVDEAGLPLAGAVFEIRTIHGTLIAEVTTNNGGIATVPQLAPGVYEIIETRAPQGFEIIERGRVIEVFAGQTRRERFVNYRTPGLIIEKVDAEGNPLQGAEFEVRTMEGALVVRVTSNNSGVATVAQIAPGTYQVLETRAPAGFVLDSNAQFVTVSPGETATLRFVNHREPSIIIEKVDTDGNPLANAEFEIRTLDGALISRGVTNQGGMLIITGLDPGAFEITETRAPAGFVITEPSRVVQVTAGQSLTERFVNHRSPALIIEKVCENGEPLAGAEFEVRRLNGELVHRVVTDNGGLAIVAELAPGAYQLTETRPPEGFAIVDPSRAIQITAGETRTERFVNPRLATFVINKIDGVTGRPLQGVVFEITTLEGEHIRNPANGSFEFVTDSSGLIRLPMLAAGSYVATETRPLPGFKPAEPMVFVVGHDRDYIITVRNYPWPDYNIRKIDGHTGQPMQGVQFEIATFFANGSTGERLRNPLDGSFVWTTDQAGLIRIPSLPHGTFVATETLTLPGFRLAEPVVFVVSDFEPTTLTVRNYRYSEWNIRKLDGNTGEPLAGVVFEVATFHGSGTTGERVRNALDGSFEFVTNAAGIARIGPLSPNTYIITETRALPGFIPAEPVIITVTGSEADTTVTIYNYREANLTVRKTSGDTGTPLAGVVFEVSTIQGRRIQNPIDNSFEFVTNNAGLIFLPHLPAGIYVVTETRPLAGYRNADPVTFEVVQGQDLTIDIRNYKYPSVVIRKICGETGQRLQGVVFEIVQYFQNGQTGQRLKNYAVDGSYEFVTDASGHIYLPVLPDGVWMAVETRPLPGFIQANPVIFRTGVNGDHTVIVRNYRYTITDVAILKLDGTTRQPLAGVEFQIARDLGGGRAGELLINPANLTTTWVTDSAGRINISNIEPGRYVAIETRALPGFSLASPMQFVVVEGQDQVFTVYNFRVADWVIRKTDGDTDRPLAGVHFEIARYFGSSQAGERLRNPVDGSTTFITDEAGLIRLPNLEPGTYIAIETRALPGFILADPVIFVVGDRAENTTIDIQNFRTPNLTIRKINSVTRQPIQGVVFQIARINGERITNPQTGMFDFTTDRNGLIHLPAMEDGTFLVTEIRAAQGYFGLDEAVLLEINSRTRQQNYLLVIENTPASGLLILKTDANTGAPLQGVEFEVRHADGRLVRGLMADQNQPGTHANSPNITPNGNFLTDHRGMIHLNHLDAGVYHITETRALPGYLLDSTVHVVTITPGRLTTLEVVNEQMAGLRLTKIDSVTRRGIQGVEFRIFDFITNREVAGPFITDNNGVIDFTGILPAGRYTIRETREAPGYLRDTMPRTIEFRAGMITEVVWENTREAGQIQITKLSSADNQVNGLPAGSRLAGAVFEVRDWRTGNVIDQFITDARGVGVSRPLPLGRYLIEEIVAPPFYKRSDVVLDVTIEHSGQILRYEFFNEPANVGVEVRKTGPVEVMSGQPIVWTITTIANSSTIALSDFYVRDILPAHAVRLDRIFTGTFNQSVRYSIMFRTNLNDTWRVAYDNLLSTTNNALVMSPAALGLRSNEFVTEFMFSFGTVRAGFRSVEAPRVEGTVRDGLQNGYEFVNRVDIGGRTGTEWVIGNNVWVTRVFRPTQGNHPRTGF